MHNYTKTTETTATFLGFRWTKREEITYTPAEPQKPSTLRQISPILVKALEIADLIVHIVTMIL